MAPLVWTAHRGDDETRLVALSDPASLDWFPIDVPGEWRTAPALADHAGSVLYRTEFVAPAGGEDRRLFVRSGGIFDRADLWLDGAYLGDQDDYFLEHSYDITGLSSLGAEHSLVVEVTGGVHAGPWKPIALVTTGPAALASARVLCRDASDERAHLMLRADIDCDTARAVTVRTTVDGTVASERVHRLARGSNEVSWTIDIASPGLWWPWSLGSQPLSTVEVSLFVDGEPSDSCTRRTGLREVSAENWTITVNGERLHAKGAYLDMPDLDLGTTPGSWHADNVAHARAAGLDLLRLHHHVAHPALYEAADEAGLLLWQDVPPRISGRRGRRVAGRWARGLVDALGHHPSVALWHHDMLDRWTRTALGRNDPTRTSLGHLSTAIPDRAVDDPRASVLRGALAGAGRDLASAVAVIPNLARFPTHEQWRVIDGDNDELIRNPTTVQRTIDTLRLVRFRPSGGFAFLKLRDDSVLDDSGLVSFAGERRAMFDVVADACRPVSLIAVVDASAGAGETTPIAVYVVNDGHTDFDEARIRAEIRLGSGDRRRVVRTAEWIGVATAGEVVGVGEVDVMLPPESTEISVELAMFHPGLPADGLRRTISLTGRVDEPY